MPKNKFGLIIWNVLGIILLPCVWWFISNVLKVSPRYLPPIGEVANAWIGLDPPITVHFFVTMTRLVGGFVLGTALGIFIALFTARFGFLDRFLMPSINSMRSVPAAAVVPFFLLWFGFSETGRYLLATVAVALNVAIASRELLNQKVSSHESFFYSFGISSAALTLSYALPRVIEGILPTLRYSLAVALGAVTVSELLGSQVGLGYLIQSSRSTFSHHLLFLCMILLGVLSVICDYGLCALWKRLTYWRTTI